MQVDRSKDVRVARVAAVVSLSCLAVMVSITAATGVAQEPFEVVRPLPQYQQAIWAAAGPLRWIVAVDALFILAYSAFFVAFARVGRDGGDAGLLRFGVAAMLVTAGLDVIEDHHLLAMCSGVFPIGAGELTAQHVLSQVKFHVSYVAVGFFALGLPRRDALERGFALAVGVPLPVLGALAWAAPELAATVGLLRWAAFVLGFVGALVVLRRR